MGNQRASESPIIDYPITTDALR